MITPLNKNNKTLPILDKGAHKNILFLLLIACIFALVLAYISQYVFDMQPCQLCLWQRKPFFAIIGLSSLFLIIPQLKNYQNLVVKTCVILLVINSVIAFYHAGVEKKWFAGLDSCLTANLNVDNLEDLKLALEKTKAVRCDKPQFIFLGLSMASWNMLYCLALITFAIRFPTVLDKNIDKIYRIFSKTL